MTKADLIRCIVLETGIDKNVATAVVESAMKNIKDSLIKGVPVYLRGFGSFILRTRKKKTARNITAKTTVIIPEHKVPVFKPAKEFKDAVK